MKILAISGSLRAASLNTALLRVVQELAPPDISVTLVRDLDQLPLFNPDLEGSAPPAVAHLRERLVASDAVIIASPEYAHGITGAMKNALDWMVGCEVFVNKPVALLNASPRAVHAQAALKEVITMMSARVVEDASITVPVLGFHSNQADILADTDIVSALRHALEVLHTVVRESC
ncbi:MAG: NADPH-dependent FMN reductase [Gammaproteobacteria bacterium]